MDRAADVPNASVIAKNSTNADVTAKGEEDDFFITAVTRSVRAFLLKLLKTADEARNSANRTSVIA